MQHPVVCEVCGHDGYRDKLIPCANSARCGLGRHVWCLEGAHQHDVVNDLLADDLQLQCWHCAQFAGLKAGAATGVSQRPVPLGNRTGPRQQQLSTDGDDDDEEPEVAYESTDVRDQRPPKRARLEPGGPAAGTAVRAAAGNPTAGGVGGGRSQGRGGLAGMLPPQSSGRRVQTDQEPVGLQRLGKLQKLEDDIDAFDDLTTASPIKPLTQKGPQPGMPALGSRQPGAAAPPAAAGRLGGQGTSQATLAASTQAAAPASRPPLVGGRGRTPGRIHPAANRSGRSPAFSAFSAVASRGASTSVVPGAGGSTGNTGHNRAVADQASQPAAAAGLVQGPEPAAAGQAAEKEKDREALWTGVLNVDQIKNQLKVTLTAIFPHEAMEQLADRMNPKRDNLHVTWRVPSADEEIPACIIRSRDFYAQDDIIPCETCVVMDIYNMFGGAAFDELLSVVRGTPSHILVAEFPTLRREDLEKAPILSRLLACAPPPPQEGRAAQVWEPPYRLYFTPSVVPADRFDMEKGSKQLFLCLTGSRYQVQELSTWDKEWAGTPIVKHDPPDGNQAVGPKRVAWRMAGSDDDDLPQHQPVHDKGIAQREKLQEKAKDIKNALTQRPSAEEEAEDAAAEAAERQAAPGTLEPAQVQPPAAEAGIQASAASQLLTADQSASSEGHTNTEPQLPAVLHGAELQPQQPAPAHVPTAPPALAEDFAHQASGGLAGSADDASQPEGHLDASVEEDAETGTPTAEVASRPLDSMVLSTGAGASGQPMEAIMSQSLHPAPGTAQQEPNWRHALPAGMGAAACVSSSGRLWSWRDVQAPSLAAEHVESTATATKAPAEWKWSQRSLPVLQMPCMEQPNSISRELRIRLPHLWSDLRVLRSAPLRGLRLLLVASEVEKHQMEAGLQQAQLVLGLKWAWRVPSAPAPEDLSEYQVLALGSSAMEALSDKGSNIFLKSVGVHPIHVFSAEPLVNSLRLLVEEAMQPDDQAGEASVPTLSKAAQLVAGGGVPLFPDRVVIMMDAQGFMDSSPQVLRQLLGCLEAGTQAWGEPWTLRMRKADIEQVQRAGGEHREIVQGALDGAQGPLLVALTPREESTKLGDKLLRDAVRLLHETKPGRLVVQAYTSRQATEEVVKKGRLCKDVLSGAVEEVLAFLDLILINGWQHAGPGLQPM